jgi:hypothetical protein
MKPLICPQCGGKITNYSKLESFANCCYCNTKFLIKGEEPKPESHNIQVFDPPKSAGTNPNISIGVIAAVVIFIGGFIFLAVLMNKNAATTTVYPTYKPPFSTPSPRSSPAPTPNPNLLEFGGKGTGNGMFKDADSITVDSKGRIYVADGTLRVQQFNELGEFLKVWQIPSETKYYKRARAIHKILVDGDDRLHVLVDGLILVYENDSSQPLKVIHFAPNFIQDFTFRSDGGKLFVINNGEIESLFHVSDKGKTLKKSAGFHTNAADAQLSPYETGLAAIRIAVDGAGNIFSVYAFGDLGSYTLNYNAEELLIFRFTPEGKYVNKFVQSHTSCGIEVDNQSRVYVSRRDEINAYSNSGELLATAAGFGFIESFALDKENNIYVLSGDKVVKRRAIQ